MSKTAYGPDGFAFTFPDNTPEEVISRTIRNHYQSQQTAQTRTTFNDEAWKANAVPEVHHRNAWERLGDNFMDSASRSALLADWRSKFINPALAVNYLIPVGIKPLVEGAPKELESLKDWGGLLSAGVATAVDRSPYGQFVGTAGALTGVAARKVYDPDIGEKVRTWERDRRTAFAKASAEDPWYGVEGGFGKTVHGAAALVGTLGGAATDPLSYASGGSSVAARVAVQAAVAGGGDILTQGFDVQAGIQDDYDAGQTLAAAATGAAFQGVLEGGGALLKKGVERLRAPKVDPIPQAPVEAHFKDVLDASDLVNEAPLTYTKIRDAAPTHDVYQWFDPFEANKVDPSITNPAPKADPTELLANLPSPLLAKIKANIGKLGDAIPVEKTEAFARWMREGGTKTPDWIDFTKIADQPERLEVLSDMLKEMFDDAYKLAGKERVHFEDVVERTKALGISADDAIVAHAGITGERGLSTALHTMQVVSDAHFAQLDDILAKADGVLADPLASEGAKNDAMAAISKHLQLASLHDAQLRGAKAEVARTLRFMRETKDRSRTINELDAYTKEIFNNDLDLDQKRKLIEGLRSTYRKSGARGVRQEVRKLNTMGPLDLIDFWTRGAMLSTPDVIINNIVSTAANIEWDLWMEGNLRAAIGTAMRLFDRDGVNRYSFRQQLVSHREYRVALARNLAKGINRIATDTPGIWRDIGEYVGGVQGPNAGLGDTLNRIGYAASYLPNHAIDGLFRTSIREAQIAGYASERAYQLSKRWASANTREARVKMNEVYRDTYNAMVQEPTAEAITAAQKFFGVTDLNEARDKYLFGSSDEGDLHLAVMEGMDIRQFADDAALRLTFNSKNALASKINLMTRHNAVTRVLGNLTMPFVRTPLNVMQAMVRVAPGLAQLDALGKVAKKLADNEKIIFADQNAWADYLGRQAASMALLAIAAPLFADGLLVGANGLGIDKRNGNSIKLGDKYVKFQDLGAAGQALGVLASVYEVANVEADEDGDSLTLASKVAIAGMTSFMQVSLFRGLNDFLNFAVDGQKSYTAAMQYAASQVAARVPFMGLANWADKVTDPTVKDIYDDDFMGMIKNAIEARIPQADGDLPDKLDLFGRQIDRNRGPRSVQFNELDDISEEFLNIARVTGDKFRSPARRFQGEKITAKEYQQVLRVQGQLYRDPDTGLNMEEAVTALIHSYDWQTYSWSEKGAVIRKLISDYRSAANAEIRDPDSPYYMEGMVKRVGAQRFAKAAMPDDTDAAVNRRARRYGLTEEDRAILFGDKDAFKDRKSDDAYDRFDRKDD